MSDELQKAVFESLGTASMCWEPRPTGVFDSSAAQKVGNELIEKINGIIARDYCKKPIWISVDER